MTGPPARLGWDRSGRQCEHKRPFKTTRNAYVLRESNSSALRRSAAAPVPSRQFGLAKSPSQHKVPQFTRLGCGRTRGQHGGCALPSRAGPRAASRAGPRSGPASDERRKSHCGVEGLVLERKALRDGHHARRCTCGTLRKTPRPCCGGGTPGARSLGQRRPRGRAFGVCRMHGGPALRGTADMCVGPERAPPRAQRPARRETTSPLRWPHCAAR
jgi:hypothetical protein